jgi:Tol biopolymer transport system component
MHRLKIVVLSLTGLALLAVAAGSIAASPAKQARWKILLSSDREGDSELYSVNADGTGAVRLTYTPGVDGFASYSPDGRKILYHRQDRRTGRIGGVVMNADGSGKRWLPSNGSWSPDGRKIVFSSGRDGNGEIYVMNADGSEQRRIVAIPSSHEFSPEWSPDGRTIAFATERDGNREIYAMDVDGRNQRNLTRHPLRDLEYGDRFRWSPDGRRIAFTTNRDRNTELYVMNADGSGQHRLTRTQEHESLLGWSPDGSKLAFRSEPVKPRSAFFLMNADGSGLRKVTWALPKKR